MAFKFPPPPPPPPKNSVIGTPEGYSSQQGGRSRGRNDRGSGRGGQQSPQCGDERYVGNARSHAQSRGGRRGDQRHPRGGGLQRRGSLPMATPSNVPNFVPHINSALTQQWGGQLQPPTGPNALVQAMSFMATPAGQQSMAAFPIHMTSLEDVALQHPASPPSRDPQPAPSYLPPQHAGQKRKLNDRNNGVPSPLGSKLPQQTSKLPRIKAAVPPPVPSFGFSLPLPPVTHPANAPKDRNKKDQKKGKVNLGLTRHPLPEESSEEEDIDEEATFAAKLKGGGFVFEHEGEQITIRTAAEVAAWVKDRRANFPTQKRTTEKAHNAAAKRMAELNFLRALKGEATKGFDAQDRDRPLKVSSNNQNNRKKKEEEDGKQRQERLAALRKRLHESVIQNQAVPTIDFGLGYSTETDSDDDSSVLSESSVVSSSKGLSEESDVELDESDAAPEPISSKVGPPPFKVPPPPPPPAAFRLTKATDAICQNWARNGRCNFSNKCKFVHPPKEDKRKGLFGIMVEQELVRADELALDAIKYLGRHNFLG